MKGSCVLSCLLQHCGLDRGSPVLGRIRHESRLPEERQRRAEAQTKRHQNAARKEQGDSNSECKSVTVTQPTAHRSPAPCTSTAIPSFPGHRDVQCCLLQLFLMGPLKAELSLTYSPLLPLNSRWDLICQ